MTVEYIRYRIPIEQHRDFIQAYLNADNALIESPFCLGYELTKCEVEPERFILRIQWTSLKDHIEKFLSRSEFRNFLPHIRPFIDNIEEMQHYQLTEVIS